MTQLKDYILVWLFRCVMGVAFIFSVYIIKKNNMNRKQAVTNNRDVIPTKYLDIWSKCTLYGTSFSIIIFASGRIPKICSFTYQINRPSYGIPKIFLTFYQISRLQLCSSESKIHSKYGYSKYLFIILYIIGIILMFCITIHSLLFTNIAELPNNLGCVYTDSANRQYLITTLLVMGLYAFWDLFVLMLYVFKVHQATNKLRDNKIYQTSHKKILTRVHKILNKILFLTIIYEIVCNVTVYTTMVVYNMTNSTGNFLFGFDYMVTVYVMYLMLEHNTKDYTQFLMTMRRLWIMKLFCCCFTNVLTDQTTSEFDGIGADKHDECEIESDNFDTRTLGVLPSPKNEITINNSEPTDIMNISV
eukprot:11807_1